MKRTLSTVVCLTLTFYSFSQITFIKHYGQSSGQGNSLLINSTGNYIIAGKKTNGLKRDDFFVCEINAYGDTLWLDHYGTDSL